MFNTQNGYSLADIAAATNGINNDGWGGNGGWWIILLFLLVFAGGGWGNRGGLFGYNGGPATTASGVTDGYILTSDFATIERKLDDVNNGLCNGFYTEAQLVNGVNTNIASSTNSLLMQLNNNQAATTAQITGIGTQLQSCCCDMRHDVATQFANLNYNLADQSCQTRRAIADSTAAITANQDANTRSILDFLTQDKIASLTAENQSLKFAASQQAQNAYLVSTLSPQPAPAYIVPNPLTGQYGCNTCNCGCAC